MLDWLPICTERHFSRCLTVAIFSGFFSFNPLPIPIVDNPSILKWQPTYPNRLDRLRQLRDFSFNQFNPYPIPIVDSPASVKWFSTYPNQLNIRKRIQPVDFTVIDPFQLTLPETILTDKWTSTYPNRFDRLRRVQSTDFSLITLEVLTLDKWYPTYPNQLNSFKRIQSTIIQQIIETVTIDKWIPSYPTYLNGRRQPLWANYFSIPLNIINIIEIITCDKWYSIYPNRFNQVNKLQSSYYTLYELLLVPITDEAQFEHYARRYLDDPNMTTYTQLAELIEQNKETIDTIYFRKYMSE